MHFTLSYLYRFLYFPHRGLGKRETIRTLQKRAYNRHTLLQHAWSGTPRVVLARSLKHNQDQNNHIYNSTLAHKNGDLFFCGGGGGDKDPFLNRVMDLWSYWSKMYCRMVLFLFCVFQDYLTSMLDCPPTCSCSLTEIYCNKTDNGKFFPLLALQDTGRSGNSSVDITELFKNISSM